MEVRPYKGQHERADDLPLVSESARVTEVEVMDERRDAEVRAALAALLDVDSVADAPDWDRLLAVDAPRRVRDRVGVLRDRFERPYPSLLRFRFRTDEPFEFVAGQYVSIRYRGRVRAYSVASSPNREAAELCVRRVPDGRLSELLCEELRAGDELTVRGPHGDFLLQDPSSRDAVFVATGSGVTPFKSMIDYAFEEGWDEGRDVWLFLGAAWLDDLPYREYFRELDAARPNFHFVPTLSREPYLSAWDGETAYIQQVLLKYVAADAVVPGIDRNLERFLAEPPADDVDARLDPQAMEVYACGINPMIYSLLGTVERLGVPEECVSLEGFG